MPGPGGMLGPGGPGPREGVPGPGEGVPGPGGSGTGGAWWRPLRRLLLWVVRILLECILVFFHIFTSGTFNKTMQTCAKLVEIGFEKYFFVYIAYP